MPAQETAMVAVSAYRQLLRNMRSAGGAAPAEESAAALQQAKERVMLRIASARGRIVVQRDPRRALARLRDQMARLRQAKDNLRDAGSARAARLRLAYDSLKQRSLRAVSASSGSRRDELEVLGSNGVWRTMVLSSVIAASKVFMHRLSRTIIEGEAVMQHALARPPGQPLITVSNHVAAMDDPLLLAALTPLRNTFERGGVRWSLCATDRCFKGPLLSAFFRAGQVLPVERGRGMEQPGMRAAQQRLNAGDWVHIFPEGTRSPDGTTMGQIRPGVGRLVAGCESLPLVVPIVHMGMENVMPRGGKLPVPGQKVRILVGDPVKVDDVLRRAEAEQWSETRLYRAIAMRISVSMAELKARLIFRVLCSLGRIYTAQLDGAPLPATRSVGALDDQHMLPMIEDELDAASRPWGHASLRQAAGIPPVSASVTSPVSAAAQLAARRQPGYSARGGGVARASGVANGSSIWSLLGAQAAGYAQARMQHVAAMLAPVRNPAPQMAF